MKKFMHLFPILLLILVGCSGSNGEEPDKSATTANPTAKEVFTNNKDADIFLYREIVYQNAEDLDWVKDLELTKGKEVKEIKRIYSGKGDFPDHAATKLPVGNKVYEAQTNHQLLIAVVEGKEIPYIGLVEG